MQDLLRVLQTLGEFSTGANKLVVEVVRTTITLLVNVGNEAFIRRKKQLGLVVKDDLNCLVAQAEKNGVLRSHPFLKVDHGRRCAVGWQRGCIAVLLLLLNEVVVKVFQKRHFLL